MARIICVGWATKKLYQLVGNTWELSPIDPGIPLSAGLWGGSSGTLWAHRHPSPGGFLFYNGNNWSEPGWTMGYEDNAPWSMHGTADGSRIYAVSNGNIWRYDGVIWQHAKALSPTLKSVWCNDSGRHVIIGTTSSKFWYSDDYGATWSDLYPDAVSQTGLDPIGRCLAPWGVSDDGDECRIYLGTNGRYLLRYNTASNAWTHLTTAAHSFQGGLVGDESEFITILSQNLGPKWIYSITGGAHTEVHEFPGDASPESSIDGRRMFAIEGEIACGLESGPGSNYYARRSIDGGSTWAEVPSGTQVDIYNFASYDLEPPQVPPVLQNQNPSPSSSGNDSDTGVYLEVVDQNGDLDESTVSIYINGTLAWTGDAVQTPGLSGFKSPVTNGYGYTISPWEEFDPGSQSIRVVAEDSLGNTLDETYSFSTDAPAGICTRSQWGDFQWGDIQWAQCENLSFSIVVINEYTVRVYYRVPVKQIDPTSQNDALNPDNYEITGGFRKLDVLNVTSFDESTVELTVLEMTDGATYTLNISDAIKIIEP